MKSRPEDRPKIIGLGIAILGVLVYVVITLVPKITGAQPAPPPGDPPPAAAPASAAAGSAGTANESSTPLPDDDTAAIPPPAAHDSFTPPVGSKTPIVPVAGSPAPPPVQPARKAVSPAEGAHAAGITGPLAPAAIAPIPPAPLPAIELKGVILGDPAMAILSVNNEVVQRQEGETIAATLKVIKIQEEGILIQDGKKQTLVAVGHAFGAPVNK